MADYVDRMTVTVYDLCQSSCMSSRRSRIVVRLSRSGFQIMDKFDLSGCRYSLLLRFEDHVSMMAMEMGDIFFEKWSPCSRLALVLL